MGGYVAFPGGMMASLLARPLAVERTATGFDLRYTGTMAPPEKDWRDCSEVLSRRDFATLMRAGWG